MNEGLINLVDDDSSQDVHGTGGHGEDDRLATSRLHAQAHVPPPPPPSRRPLQSQGSGPSGVAGVLVPPPRQSAPNGPASPGGMLYPSEPPPALPRTSWWRSLIASTLAPPEEAVQTESADRRLGKVCVGLALGFAFAALVVGLRSAPADSAGVAVAIVASRTIIALGVLAFGYALLRMGERFLGVQGTRKSDD